MSGDERIDRLTGILRTERAASVLEVTQGHPLAIGWATVELDRTVADIVAALQIPAHRFTVAPGSVALGARCLIGVDVLPGGVALLLLEPNTEGRLAATLARHDEGPAAAWLGAGNLADAVARLSTVGHPASPAQAGPFGSERLVNGPRYGPHLLLVEWPGTIRA